jgi:outer membrane biosynthesis protein TonB
MPILETPPNPAPPSPTETNGIKVRTGRFGELEEHELIHLLDTLDDERERARFRESVYISLFFWAAVAWFVLYGPRFLFHQPRIVTPSVAREHEMTSLNLPADVAKALQHAPRAQKAPPAPKVEAAKPAPPAPKQQAAKPLPEAPKPQTAPAPPAQSQPTPLPAKPAPTPQNPALLPAAPAPSRTPATPNFSNQDQSARDLVQRAAQAPRGGSLGTGGGPNGPIEHRGMGTGVDILSDTMGVDFNPYLQKIMREIYNTWIPLIPEEARPPLNKQGETQIRFIILPDGRIGGMVLEGSTHDDAINKSCWGSITGVGQFPPLPSQFHGPNLELRIHYLVNKEPQSGR